jgi:hypothetical protein
MKTIEENGITYTLTIEAEEVPIEGNAMASGDDAEDKKAEEWIRAELKRGNLAVWCCLKVEATIQIGEDTFSGADYLGCCSCRDEAEAQSLAFEYYDMKAQARESLIRKLEAIARHGSVARKALLKVKGVKS